MIPRAVDLAPRKASASTHDHAVIGCLGIGAKSDEHSVSRCNTVAFLQAQALSSVKVTFAIRPCRKDRENREKIGAGRDVKIKGRKSVGGRNRDLIPSDPDPRAGKRKRRQNRSIGLQAAWIQPLDRHAFAERTEHEMKGGV